MPELPDVENYRRFLSHHALNRTIAAVVITSARVVEGTSGRKLADALKGRTFKQTCRHGKHVLARMDDGGWLSFHFGMTGHFAWFSDMAEDPKHDRLRFDFQSGHHLAFVNQRLLGRVEPAKDADSFVRAKQLGPDALEIAEDAFCEGMGNKSGAVKSALMDQGMMAGIGNVFSDEILFHARLYPKTPVKTLDRDGLSDLHGKMRHVLTMAIDRGAGAEDFAGKVPASWLLAHRRAGAACPRCAGTIATLKVSSRTAYYCPTCQPK